MIFTSEFWFFPHKASYLQKVFNNSQYDSPVHDIHRSFFLKAIYGHNFVLVNASQRKTKQDTHRIKRDLKATYFPDRRLEDLQWDLDLIQVLKTAQLGLLFSIFHTKHSLQADLWKKY